MEQQQSVSSTGGAFSVDDFCRWAGIDQTWLIAEGTAKGNGRSRTRRLRGLIRRFSLRAR